MDNLLEMYRTYFNVFETNERGTWYDRSGEVVWTWSNGIESVGWKDDSGRKPNESTWRRDFANMSAGSTLECEVNVDFLPSGPQKIKRSYVAPFVTCDREADYRRAWAFLRPTRRRRPHRMLPSILAREVQTSLRDQLRASFSPTTKSFDRLIDDFVEAPDTLIKGPWLSLELPFRRTKSEAEFFPNLALGFRAYSHQEKAFRRLSGEQPRSSIVATGTGSGKTECFLYPILDACIRAKGQGGVKAIIIYPMNALAADQARRIAALVVKTPALAGLRVGIYADERPENPSDEMTATEVINSREALIRDPPDILLTNYKMLDYMLLRPEERDLWERNRPETLRYLVVDELHTFDGAQGTDLASLIRRLKSRLGMPRGRLCCVGTSATLVGPGAIPDLLAYARHVFDEDFDDDAIVVEDRQTVGEYLDGLDTDYTDFPSASQARSLSEAASDIGRSALIAKAYAEWFRELDPPTSMTRYGGWNSAIAQPARVPPAAPGDHARCSDRYRGLAGRAAPQPGLPRVDRSRPRRVARHVHRSCRTRSPGRRFRGAEALPQRAQPNLGPRTSQDGRDCYDGAAPAAL